MYSIASVRASLSCHNRRNISINDSLVLVTSSLYNIMKSKWLLLVVVFGVGNAAVNDITNSIDETPAVINIADCGKPNRTISINSFSINPNPIPNPGSTNISVNFNILHKLPATGLKMKILLEKLEPRRMRIPCFRRFGSCTYDICRLITDYSSTMCSMFPPSVLCSCQLEAETYNLSNIDFPLPNFGRIIRKLMEGSYIGNATILDSEREYGCARFQFEIQNNRQS